MATEHGQGVEPIDFTDDYADDFTEVEPVVTPNPTQARHPWRATARTIFAAVIALAAMLPLLVEASGVDETAGAVAGALAIAGAITRIMAIPQVNDFLERFLPFLGATGGDQA